MAKSTEQDFQKELKQITDTLEELLESGGERSKAELDKLKAKAEGMLKDARGKFSEAGEKICEHLHQAGDSVSAKAQQAKQCTNDYVQSNPWTSVGIGAAVGVLVGILLCKR